MMQSCRLKSASISLLVAFIRCRLLNELGNRLNCWMIEEKRLW